MSGIKNNNGASPADDFDLHLELSSLIADQIIPRSIAEKLEKKINEKQLDITKEQLHAIVNKIHNFLQEYQKNGSLPDKEKLKKNAESDEKQKTDTNQNQKIHDDSLDESAYEDNNDFLEKIENLQQKIDLLIQEKQDPNIENETNSTNQYNPEEMEFPYDDSFSTEHLTADPLQSINQNPESIIVLMNWLQYLVNRCGRENLSNVLDYYVEIDWITDDVKISLLEYSQGITEAKNQKDDSSSKNKQQTSELSSKEHIQSYLYIQRLKGRKFKKHFVERINGELARIEKKIDMYYHTQ